MFWFHWFFWHSLSHSGVSSIARRGSSPPAEPSQQLSFSTSYSIQPSPRLSSVSSSKLSSLILLAAAQLMMTLDSSSTSMSCATKALTSNGPYWQEGSECWCGWLGFRSSPGAFWKRTSLFWRHASWKSGLGSCTKATERRSTSGRLWWWWGRWSWSSSQSSSDQWALESRLWVCSCFFSSSLCSLSLTVPTSLASSTVSKSIPLLPPASPSTVASSSSLSSTLLLLTTSLAKTVSLGLTLSSLSGIFLEVGFLLPDCLRQYTLPECVAGCVVLRSQGFLSKQVP